MFFLDPSGNAIEIKAMRDSGSCSRENKSHPCKNPFVPSEVEGRWH